MFESLESRQMFSTTITIDAGSTQTADTTPQPSIHTDIADLPATKLVDIAAPHLNTESLNGKHVR
jgi:hypothetical protein